MVTVRTYWNLAEAALAKSLLDNYEIFSALFHENAFLYGRAPFAMPIRLAVDERKADQALCVLSNDLERAAQIELSEPSGALPIERRAPLEITNHNPWELLVLAFYFLLPGICVLRTKYPVVVANSLWIRREIAAVAIFHFLGWLALGFAAFLIALYFRLRRSSIVEDSWDADAANGRAREKS